MGNGGVEGDIGAISRHDIALSLKCHSLFAVNIDRRDNKGDWWGIFREGAG
jgi:hypothetical protein